MAGQGGGQQRRRGGPKQHAITSSFYSLLSLHQALFKKISFKLGHAGPPKELPKVLLDLQIEGLGGKDKSKSAYPY